MLLQAEHISKSFSHSGQSDISVLENVSLTLNDRSSTAIVGSSGSGKSTLLHILGGLDKPDSGKVLFRDENIHSWNKKQLASFRNKELGFVFQFHHLLPEFTAFENICMPGMIQGKKMDDIRPEAEHLMGLLGISHRQTHRPSELSGGEQQRVAVARALINKPSLLLADEPTGNLDEANTDSMLNVFFEAIESRNIALIMVTHDIGIAKECDSVAHLHKGVLSRD